MLQILLLLHLLLHLRIWLFATSIIYNAVFPIMSIVQWIYGVMCRIPSTRYDSSTVNTTAEESYQRRKTDYLACYTIAPVTVEELCQLLLKNPANEFRNTK